MFNLPQQFNLHGRIESFGLLNLLNLVCVQRSLSIACEQRIYLEIKVHGILFGLTILRLQF